MSIALQYRKKLSIQLSSSYPIKREPGEIIKLTRSIELRVGFEARTEFHKEKKDPSVRRDPNRFTVREPVINCSARD